MKCWCLCPERDGEWSNIQLQQVPEINLPHTPKRSEFKCAFAAPPPDASPTGGEDTEDLSTSLWEPEQRRAPGSSGEGKGRIPQVSLNGAGQACVKGTCPWCQAFPHTDTRVQEHAYITVRAHTHTHRTSSILLVKV